MAVLRSAWLQNAPANHSGTRKRAGCHAFQSLRAGFLPDHDPLERLASPQFAPWEDAVAQLPKRAVAAGRGELREWLEGLPEFPLGQLLALAPSNTLSPSRALSPSNARGVAGSAAEERANSSSGSSNCRSGGASSSSGGGSGVRDGGSEELWRAYLLLSFLAHGYLWCDAQPPPAVLPARLAAPWCAVAAALGMPPVLTYSTYNLYNWRRLDPAKPVVLGNIVCLHNFLGGIDEEWFRLIHVQIEAQAAPAMAALPGAQRAAAVGDVAGVRQALDTVTAALIDMQATLGRMGEKCDPHVYYQRVRLPMSGWRNNPALPEGLIYEGQFGGQPQQLYGETGAQSSILHALDASLGVQHDACSWLKAYLLDMRSHMPPAHRAFVESLEAGPTLRQAAEAAPNSLKGPFNDCLAELERFRSQHKAFAFAYIAKHSKKAPSSSANRGSSPGAESGGQVEVGSGGEVGTGGTDFMPALAGYRDATSASKLP